ncbi:MAG TPA: hypothetical protein VN081_04445 [Dongiaceae bacterium]|nr:hypothetical protein [Dongiaceae bacterium]
MARYTYTRTITDEELADLMTTALAGIAYWANLAKLADENDEFDGYLSNALALGKPLKIHVIDEPDDEWHTLTLEKVLEGLSKRTSFDPLNYDALDGDAIIQYALFGELVYA